MRVSTRNTLTGHVKQVERGPIHAEVTLELSGGTTIVSVITRHAADALGLIPGKPVYALIKASDIIMATDD
jgi:molybdopterin-binding protein